MALFPETPGHPGVEYLIGASIRFQVAFEPSTFDQSVTLSAVPPVPIVVTNADGTTRSIPVQ